MAAKSGNFLGEIQVMDTGWQQRGHHVNTATFCSLSPAPVPLARQG